MEILIPSTFICVGNTRQPIIATSLRRLTTLITPKVVAFILLVSSSQGTESGSGVRSMQLRDSDSVKRMRLIGWDFFSSDKSDSMIGTLFVDSWKHFWARFQLSLGDRRSVFLRRTWAGFGKTFGI